MLDLQAEAEEFPEGSAFAKRLGHRTTLGVPLLRKGVALGTIQLRRFEVNPFTDKQIELVETFADQAVIAIENARLFDELQARTRELSESLEQQTATSEVLRVISSSPGELQPVFETMLENATRLCAAKIGILWLAEGDSLRSVALHGVPPALAEARRREPLAQFGPNTPLGRAVRTRQVVHIDDLTKEPAYLERIPRVVSLVERGGARSAIFVPMLKDTELIGMIVIYRQEVRRFTDKQVALITSFARQAVIAIENARLLKELHQRTDDLSEALVQQTATSEVLGVISSSPGDLDPVFNAMLANATRICAAKFGVLFLHEDGAFRAMALHGAAPPSFVEARRRNPVMRPIPGTALGRVLAAKQTVQIADVRAEPAYATSPTHAEGIETGEIRTVLSVPMLKEGELIGAFNLCRHEVLPFTAKQIELVTGFANQAVIAIENAGLLNEPRQRTDDLSEALEQQTATSEVLSVISNSLNDTQPVFDAIVESGLKLFPGATVVILLADGNKVDAAAIATPDPAGSEALRSRLPIPLTREYMTSTCILDRKVVDVPDVASPPPELAVGARNFLASGYRANTIMPMMRGDVAIGALTVARRAPGPLTDKQRAVLYKTFAAQAVIAIENTRLLNECLRESLEQQTATFEVLQVISSSPGELEPVFQTMLENAVRLCGAKFGMLAVCEGNAFRMVAMHNIPPALAEIWRREPMLHPGPTSSLAFARSAKAKQVVQIPDITLDRAYLERDPDRVVVVDLGGYRSVLSVPMLQNDEVVGVINIFRQGVGAVVGQAGRAGEKFRKPGRHRHREHPATQRVERIAAAANRHRRRAQGDQPLDVRPSDGTRYPGRLRGTPVRGGHGRHRSAAGRGSTIRRQLPPSRRSRAVLGANPDPPGAGVGYRTCSARCHDRPYSRSPSRPRLHVRRRAAGRFSHHRRGPDAARRRADRRPSINALRRAAVHRQADRAGLYLRRPGGDRDRECAAVRRNPGQEPAARIGEPAQVAVPRQHEPRAADAAQRHHRPHRDAGRERGDGPAPRRRWSRSSACTAPARTCSASSTTCSTSRRSRRASSSCTRDVDLAPLIDDVAGHRAAARRAEQQPAGAGRRTERSSATVTAIYAGPAGAAQPPEQCLQVHRGRRRSP